MNDQQQSRADALTDEHIATLKLAARAVTPQDIDGAERIESRPDGSYITCPACEGEGCIPFESDYCNYDHVAIGVQFYGVGTEPGAAEAYFRAAKPATILALLDRLERAESALAAPPVEQPAAAPADERAALPQIPDLVKATAWLTMCLRTELSRLDDDTHKALDEVEAQLSCVRAITNGAIDYEVGAGALRQNVATVGNVILAIRNALNLAASANETGAEGATWYDRWQAECTRDHGEYDENAPIADRLRWWVPKSARHGTILLEDDLREAADELSRFPAMSAAAPADGACKHCGSTTAQACNDVGCFYLESGDGEPSAAPADERAVSFEAWCDRFPEISAVERLRDAWQEARAAASPTAEAVRLTDEQRRVLVEVAQMFKGTDRRREVLNELAGIAAAPQPVHAEAASPAAERVTAALQALSADVHTLGDGWANDEAMIGLAKKYLRVEPKPASPELSLWRDFVLLAVTDAAPQPAQADAPAEARERDDPELIAASNKGYAAGLRDGKALGACGPLAPADAGEAAAWRYRTSGDNWCYCDGDPVHVCDRDYEKQPLYTAPPAARVASLTNSQREAIEFAAKTMEARMLNAHACVLRALLNGVDKS
ncbi:gp43 [Burkholderia pseudomallei]|uniref:hypothetical protein n=1 Tax=Burkholderia pseudomallei TaxID=28450 RepID=UPI000976DB1D|nr:hypothetical protein [Burkholderia pseudomallei]OMR45773.1 hypothetical protein AQ724_04925 [Burkholderia pseudomallei]CAJ3295238.1 gp43 [Burkholderia pseudomallei]VBC77983.1 gp43 [Burkholderia pseudomallei]VBC83429.1 gp43 [Burkholderia pseudomallei]VBE64864.1 gp43 [Burkholderia pseudomallei]